MERRSTVLIIADEGLRGKGGCILDATSAKASSRRRGVSNAALALFIPLSSRLIRSLAPPSTLRSTRAWSASRARLRNSPSFAVGHLWRNANLPSRLTVQNCTRFRASATYSFSFSELV